MVLIKTEMDVSGSSWKGRDSLSPQLVEYLISVDCGPDYGKALTGLLK